MSGPLTYRNNQIEAIFIASPTTVYVKYFDRYYRKTTLEKVDPNEILTENNEIFQLTQPTGAPGL